MSMLADMPVAYRRASHARGWRTAEDERACGFRPTKGTTRRVYAFVDFRQQPGQARPASGRTAGSWPDESAAFEYARGRMEQLKVEHEEAGLPSSAPLAEVRMLQVLRAVLATNSVYPTMSIDDDGSVIAEWRILRFGLEILAEPNGEVSYALRKEGLRVSGGTSVTLLRRQLRNLTAIVDQANPNWRSLFTDVDTHAR